VAKDTKVERNGQNSEMAEALFEKYVKSTIRALGSTEFYETFMDAISRADNEIQFSNRRMEKIVDTEWIEAIESVLTGFQNVIEHPRNVIREDELIVNVANAKKTGDDVVRHLATHASYVEDYKSESGEVRPNKVMQKYREDSIGQVYENRVVFTTLEMAYQFVKIRHDALLEAMSEEFGAKLKFKTDMQSQTENVHMDMFLHIRDIDGMLDTDDKNRDVFDRISRLYRILSMNMNTHFAKHMARYPRVKGTLTKTNVLKRDKNYNAIMKLLEFLRGYNHIGYTIKIIEQNPVIDEKFEQEIYRNTLFQYLLLKNHLERDKDRRLPAPLKQKKKALKPKIIKEIIEEITEDYDLPDVEVRKVLIEELTKKQLMLEEAEERRRLVEEREEKKRKEKELLKQQQAAEKEKRRLEKEAEKEKRRLEKEAEQQRLYIERMEREQEDRRRSNLFKKDIARFVKDFDERLFARTEKPDFEIISGEDFEDAAFILEETERIKKEQAAINRERKRQELEHLKQLEFEEKQKVAAEQKALEEKLERERLEAERLAREEEQKAREIKDREISAKFIEDIKNFNDNIGMLLMNRELYEAQQKQLMDEFIAEKRKRLDSKNAQKKRQWRVRK